MLESEIESYLVERVKAHGGEVRKVKWLGRKGAPDRLVLLPEWEEIVDGFPFGVGPRHYWIELKAPGKKPEPHQLREHKRLQHFGIYVLVIDSKRDVDFLLDRG